MAWSRCASHSSTILSRVMVVLYRERWGKTRWTAIEETAVKDACLDGEWKRLFFIALDRSGSCPSGFLSIMCDTTGKISD